jgi:hypothetical protein
MVNQAVSKFSHSLFWPTKLNKPLTSNQISFSGKSGKKTSLPDPKESYYFRDPYLIEVIANESKKVAALNKNVPVRIGIDGDGRGKDAFSLRSYQIEAGLKDGILGAEVIPYLDKWFPITRRDMNRDTNLEDYAAIQYDKEADGGRLESDVLEKGEKKDSLLIRAMRRAKHQLEKDHFANSGRSQLTEKLANSLGHLEQIDIAKPLPNKKKVQVPSVQVDMNILHYPPVRKRLRQVVQNISDRQSEGSRLILGSEEVYIPEIPSLLREYGYTPDDKANTAIKTRKKDNPFYGALCIDEALSSNKVEPHIYIKTGSGTSASNVSSGGSAANRS